MRIMHISNNYTPYSGGVVSSLNALLPALQQQGHEILLITLDFAVPNIIDPAWVCRIPPFLTGTYKQNRIAVPFNAFLTIEQQIFSFNPDIIHVHHPFFLGSIGKSLAHKYDIACIFTYHTMYEQYAHYIPVPACITKPLIQKIVLSFCKDVDALVTPSHGIKQYLENNAIVTPAYVIPSPLQHHFFEPLDNNIEKKRSTLFNLLYVGRFREEKNIVCLIDLFAQLDRSSHCLTLVGYGDQESMLRKRAYDHYGFSQTEIVFVIKPDLQNLRQLYADADLFLFPSQTDTQGLVLAEAMAHGTPVVAFPGPGQEDIIQQGVNGFIVSNEDDMLKHIRMIKNDTNLLKSLSYNASITSQNFSQESIIASLVDVYRAVL